METFYDEVESLEAILMDDVNIIRNPETGSPEMVETTVFPVVGGDNDLQYVCVKLQVIPTQQYPDVSPKFNLLKPRGLDDQRLNDIKRACNEKLIESLGFPVVFDLIEVIREHLTGSNLPSGQCVVCLYGFQDGDEFTKTECFHYLHSYCLARHLIASRHNWQEEIDKLPAWLQKTADPFQPSCPVCREAIINNISTLNKADPPAELQSAPEFNLTEDLKKMQQKMSNLYLIQKRQGGIIDLEAEESGVLTIETGEEITRREALEEQKRLSKLNGIGNDKHYQDNNFNGDNKNEDIGLESEQLIPDSHSYNKNNHQHRSNSIVGDPSTAPSTSTNRVTVNHSNLTPIVNNAPTRYQPDQTTNTQHFNRRHYRGGNRRYHHHREFRDRERALNEQSSTQVQQESSVSLGSKPQKNTVVQQQQQQQKANSSHGSTSNKR